MDTQAIAIRPLFGSAASAGASGAVGPGGQGDLFASLFSRLADTLPAQSDWLTRSALPPVAPPVTRDVGPPPTDYNPPASYNAPASTAPSSAADDNPPPPADAASTSGAPAVSGRGTDRTDRAEKSAGSTSNKDTKAAGSADSSGKASQVKKKDKTDKAAKADRTDGSDKTDKTEADADAAAPTAGTDSTAAPTAPARATDGTDASADTKTTPDQATASGDATVGVNPALVMAAPPPTTTPTMPVARPTGRAAMGAATDGARGVTGGRQPGAGVASRPGLVPGSTMPNASLAQTAGVEGAAVAGGAATDEGAGVIQTDTAGAAVIRNFAAALAGAGPGGGGSSATGSLATGPLATGPLATGLSAPAPFQAGSTTAGDLPPPPLAVAVAAGAGDAGAGGGGAKGDSGLAGDDGSRGAQKGPAVGDLGANAGANGTDAARPTSGQSFASELTNVRSARPGLPTGATDQVTVQLQRSVKDGDNSISMQLRPEELGRIDVRLEINKDGVVNAMITADRPQTLELLQRDSRTLERAFHEVGLQTDSGSLSFSLRGESGQQSFNQSGDSSGQRQGANSRGGRGDSTPDEAAPDVKMVMRRYQVAPGRVDVRI